jgi:hypothetical protein
MKIISDISSPRLLYVLDYIFNQRLGIGFRLVHSDDFGSVEPSEPYIMYSNHPGFHKFIIYPEGVIKENFLHHGKPGFSEIEKMQVLFKDEKPGGFGFDIFAAIFWMLSRYEEYQPYEPDEHGRFPAKRSLLFYNNLIEIPVVDLWMFFLKEKLKTTYPGLQFKPEDYEFLPTIDIDSPWSYRNKGFKRNMGGLMRDLLQKKFRLVIQRLQVLMKLKPDPFFTFAQIDELHHKYGVEPIFFILIGPYGPFDKTISIENKEFREFIKQLSMKKTIGLHPSYASTESKRQLEREMLYFEQLTGIVLDKLRQHFLKIKLPDYYHRLIETGIVHDYSFGYADSIGFRAGTSRPFLFYDLANECTTKLTIHPFSVMDVTLKDYLKSDAEDAIQRIEKIIDLLKKVDGKFVSLWHNESFDFENQWAGWEMVYNQLLKKATDK